MIILTVFHLIVHIRQDRRTGKKFFNLARISLGLLTLLLIDRLLYLIFLPNGLLEEEPQVDVVFSELPALFFLTIYSIIVIRWAEIYHFTMSSGRKSGITKLKPAIIALNSFLALAFIVLVIVFFTVPSVIIETCASNVDLSAQPPAAFVAIAYKLFYALVSIGLSISFIIYGYRIVNLMTQSNSLSGKQPSKVSEGKLDARSKALLKLIIISGVCAFCLLAQAGNLLDSSFATNQRNLVGILIFLYIVEIGPAIIFIFMFKKTSLFARFGRKKGFGASTNATSTFKSQTSKTGSSVELDSTRTASSVQE